MNTARAAAPNHKGARARRALALGVAAALALGAFTAAAGPRTAIVDANCTSTRGKVIDCTQQKCVNREGQRVTTCPGAAPAAPMLPATPAESPARPASS